MWMVQPFLAGNVLIGQVGRYEREVCLPVGVLVGVVALGIGAVVWVRRWKQEYTEQTSLAPEDQLDHYEQMVEEGLLQPDEFARIKEGLNKPNEAPRVPPPDPSSSHDSSTDIST
jgi:hypothetical protein